MARDEYASYLKTSLQKLDEMLEDDDFWYNLERNVNIVAIMQFQFTLVQELYQVEESE